MTKEFEQRLPDTSEQRLPDTLSELLTVAIEDAEALDRETYIPEAEDWHTPTGYPPKAQCRVCLAGAVIAGTFKVPSDMTYTPSCVENKPDWERLRAIDDMREGCFETAARRLEIDTSDVSIDVFRNDRHSIHCQTFSSWKEFDMHLASLKESRDKLREAGF